MEALKLLPWQQRNHARESADKWRDGRERKGTGVRSSRFVHTNMLDRRVSEEHRPTTRRMQKGLIFWNRSRNWTLAKESEISARKSESSSMAVPAFIISNRIRSEEQAGCLKMGKSNWSAMAMTEHIFIEFRVDHDTLPRTLSNKSPQRTECVEVDGPTASAILICLTFGW